MVVVDNSESWIPALVVVVTAAVAAVVVDNSESWIPALVVVVTAAVAVVVVDNSEVWIPEQDALSFVLVLLVL